MKLKELLVKLDAAMDVVINNDGATGSILTLYKGPVEGVPYSLAEEVVGYEEGIELQDNKLIITIGAPKKKWCSKTFSEWMDDMDEKEVLKSIICFLYHYDVGTIYHDEANFPEEEWWETRESSLKFFEDRLGHICKEKAIGEWYKTEVATAFSPVEDKREEFVK